MNTKQETPESVEATADKILKALEARYREVLANQCSGPRPVAVAARHILNGTLNVREEVKRLIGVDLDTSGTRNRRPVLIVASKFGVWASEVTLVAGVLLTAGYRVQIATEDGTPPHFLGPSLDPQFVDGAWRAPVVSPEEQALAFRFLNPASKERALLKRENIIDLRRLPKPPQIGDLLKEPPLLKRYGETLRSALPIATQYDALIIAGGSGAIPGLMFDRGLQSLILAFNDLNRPIMGECNGGLALAQTVNPSTERSILAGRAVTTHSWVDEYQSGWGWTAAFSKDTDAFWVDGQFDLKSYSAEEVWQAPGLEGNPLIDSEALFKNAAGPDGLFFSPPGSCYSVVVDGNLITCRTTPDGYPGVLALLAVLDGCPPLQGRFFLDSDRLGRPYPLSHEDQPSHMRA